MVVTFIDELTGIKSTYTYDSLNVVNGIQKAEFEYPKEYLDQFNKQKKYQENLPKTKQLFFNPATGKEVSYSRAKNLGLI
jgi:hypothetical protein